jgi:hypothetical protein
VLANIDRDVELQSFPRLPHLRYLQLHPPRELNEQDFEKCISTMKSLETLDLGYELPNVPEMRQLKLKLTSDDQSGVITALLQMISVYLAEISKYKNLRECFQLVRT